MANNRNDPAVPGEDSRVTAELLTALKRGPRGALLVSVISVSLLFVGWVAFYYFFFLPRGAVG